MFSNLDKDLINKSIILEPGCQIGVNLPVVVFLLKPDPKLVKIIVDLVKDENREMKFLTFFCPRCTMMCKSILEQGKVLNRIKIFELPYELIPVERDLLTLDDELSFGDLILDRSFTALTIVKCSILRLEALFGRIPSKSAKGPWSCSVLNALKKKEAEGQKEERSEIDELILLDRTTDLVTPLLTPMTYEGVIDEFYPIKLGILKLKEKVIDPDSKNPDKDRSLLLFNKDDIMFEETRNLHFNVAQKLSPKKYEELKKLCDSRDKAKTLKEMTEYLEKLRSIKPLKLLSLFNSNLNLAVHLDELVNKQIFKHLLNLEVTVISRSKPYDTIITALEKEIPIIEDAERVLRILCLLSLTSDGLPKDKYNSLMKMFVAKYGIEESLRLINLERAGLFKERSQKLSILSIFGSSSKSQWDKIQEKYNLIVEKINIEEPNDIAYAYNNYAPLSIRLIQRYLENHWNDSESKCKVNFS